MDSNQRGVVLGAVLLVPAMWAVALFFLGFRERLPAISPADLRFDAERALRLTRDFVTRFPRRVLGSWEARQSTGYVQQHLARLGYEITYGHFEAVVGSRTETGRNVLALKQGESEEILAVVAHYDTAATTVQGAMDNGSGVGVLLELAHVFAGLNTSRSLLLVASDGAEWGMLGASDLAENYPGRERILTAVSLDYVATGELGAFLLDTTGQKGGYTPPWLRELCRAVLREQGLPVLEPSGFREHLERALFLSGTDQGPFLRAGIAAINIGSRAQDAAREREVHHSAGDLIGNMRTSSFGSYGRSAERILRTLDEMPLPPAQPMGAFRFHNNLYLAATAVPVLHYLTFLPFAALLYFHFVRHARNLNSGRIQREGLEYLGVFLPLAAAYVSVHVFRGLRLLPRYSVLPGRPQDPVLESPRWGIIAGIVLAGILTALVLHFSRRRLMKKMPPPDFHASKCILMTALLAVLLLALQSNSYWAVTFLALPAWIWPAVGSGRSPARRALNSLCILAGGWAFYLVTALWAAETGLGWKGIWFEVLAISTGMFAVGGVLVALAAISLGLRFLAIQLYGSEERGLP